MMDALGDDGLIPLGPVLKLKVCSLYRRLTMELVAVELLMFLS